MIRGMKPTAFIFDMDGTLVDTSAIVHHVLKRPKNFEAFHREAASAPARPEVVQMVHDAVDAGHDILIVTAREAVWRHPTAMWLALNRIPSHAMFMRPVKDYRKDYIIKKEILQRIRTTWEVVHAVDDNPAVIQLWEEEGIPVTRIPGYYEG
jgi:phosphoglycolate phosphatase-like HAD superfamily hydrolase